MFEGEMFDGFFFMLLNHMGFFLVILLFVVFSLNTFYGGFLLALSNA